MQLCSVFSYFPVNVLSYFHNLKKKKNLSKSTRLENNRIGIWRGPSHHTLHKPGSVQFSSVAQSCPTLWDPMNRSTPGLPVHYQLPESTQTHVHRVGDAIQPSRPLSSPAPPALNLSQHQGLFTWVSSSHQVAKVLEFQLQHQFFQWTPRTSLVHLSKCIFAFFPDWYLALTRKG